MENHLGELWSLFEFLNPGMLGRANVFKMAGGGLRNPDRRKPARCWPTRCGRSSCGAPRSRWRANCRRRPSRPSIARWKPPQRKLYNELREHYRNTLLGKIAREGMGKAKIQVLEALLRLRQAACHPGLDRRQTRG